MPRIAAGNGRASRTEIAYRRQEGEAMRSKRARWVATIVAGMGLLLLGESAHAREHLLQAMGMTKLPGEAAPAFTLPDLDGKQVSLQDFRGKVVLLNFWATWCIPCREEMPAMEEIHQTFQPRGLVILAVNLRESAEPVKAFVVQHRLSFPVLLDHSGSVFRAYAAFGLPTIYVISREGQLLSRGVGRRDWTRAEGKDLIQELVTGAAVESSRDRSIQGGD